MSQSIEEFVIYVLFSTYAEDVNKLPANIQKTFQGSKATDAYRYFCAAIDYYKGAVQFDPAFRDICIDVVIWGKSAANPYHSIHLGREVIENTTID